jgi:hypothetical protein
MNPTRQHECVADLAVKPLCGFGFLPKEQRWSTRDGMQEVIQCGKILSEAVGPI